MPPRLLIIANLFLLALVCAQLDGETQPAILQGPVSQLIGEQPTANFSCTARAEDIEWVVNGSELKTSPYSGAIDVLRVSSGDVLFYSSLTFPTSLQFNSTRVRCRALSYQQNNAVESPDAYLIITDGNARDEERCDSSTGGESWHILSLSAAMAVYVALTTPLVIVLAAMYIVRQRKKTHKAVRREQVVDAKNQTKDEEEEGGDYIHMASISLHQTHL